MKELKKVLYPLMLIFFLICPTTNASNLDQIDIKELQKAYLRPTNIPFPKNNPYTEEKYHLGKILYFDPRLSSSGTQSCATCHNPSLSWTDGMATGTGQAHKKLNRKSPTLLNLAWDALFMWDGRKASLEEQVVGPIQSNVEMNMDMDTLLANLASVQGYQTLFKRAFESDNLTTITEQNLAKAIATYVRTIVSYNAPFDDWIAGDEQAISESAKRGFVVFNGKGGCASCHSGWNFSDSSFHDIGLQDNDIGRGKYLKNITSMQHAFKTVGLRNIDKRAPYMHNGALKTLVEVVDHYDHGFVERDSLADEIQPLHLSGQEKEDLIAFLHTLTSKDVPVTLPILPK